MDFMNVDNMFGCGWHAQFIFYHSWNYRNGPTLFLVTSVINLMDGYCGINSFTCY